MTSLLTLVKPTMSSLLPAGAKIVLATSGGPDSQALLDVMALLSTELHWGQLWAVGIDHQLRPNSAKDLQYAKNLAIEHHISFTQIAVDVAPHGNVLQAARNARYQALEACAERLGATHIVTGHTATDQIETVLFNLCRGAALKGATGIPIQRGHIVRPLLQISRQQILQHLNHRNIGYAEDPSNHNIKRSRSLLRHQVVPLLRQINPQLEDALMRFTQITTTEENWLHHSSQQALKNCRTLGHGLNTTALTSLHPALQRRVVRLWLQEHQLDTSHLNDVDDVLQWLTAAPRSAPKPKIRSAGKKVLHLYNDKIWCSPLPAYNHKLKLPGSIVLNDAACRIEATLTNQNEGLQTIRNNPKSRALRVAFDADRLHLPLTVRSWKTGDIMAPYGLNGHCKISDLFINDKIPRPVRGCWPVVADRQGTIIWIPGLRRSRHGTLNEATNNVAILKMLDTLKL